ncbi:MAG: hypothetical protein V4792_18450 [Pseudomonadota bacterium]
MIGNPQHAHGHTIGSVPRPQRRKQRDPWRCLSLLRYGGYAALTLLLIFSLELLGCEIAPPVAVGDECPVIAPTWLSWLLTAAVFVSVISCAVLGMHDYLKREFSYRNKLSGRRYR